MSWGVSPWVYPVWDSMGFLDLGGYFLPHFREVFNYYLLKYFLMAFLFVFFFWDSYDSNVGAFNIVPEVSEVVLILILFSFFPSASFISTILSSPSLILSSVQADSLPTEPPGNCNVNQMWTRWLFAVCLPQQTLGVPASCKS